MWVSVGSNGPACLRSGLQSGLQQPQIGTCSRGLGRGLWAHTLTYIPNCIPLPNTCNGLGSRSTHPPAPAPLQKA